MRSLELVELRAPQRLCAPPADRELAQLEGVESVARAERLARARAPLEALERRGDLLPASVGRGDAIARRAYGCPQPLMDARELLLRGLRNLGQRRSRLAVRPQAGVHPAQRSRE